MYQSTEVRPPLDGQLSDTRIVQQLVDEVVEAGYLERIRGPGQVLKYLDADLLRAAASLGVGRDTPAFDAARRGLISRGNAVAADILSSRDVVVSDEEDRHAARNDYMRYLRQTEG